VSGWFALRPKLSGSGDVKAHFNIGSDSERRVGSKKGKEGKKGKNTFLPFLPSLPFLLPLCIPLKEDRFVNVSKH
jgi:hypothetical protein